MSVIELERAFERLSAPEQEEFAEWFEAKLAAGGFNPANEDAWAAEIERRATEIENGQVQGIPGEPVFAELRQRYRPKA